MKVRLTVPEDKGSRVKLAFGVRRSSRHQKSLKARSLFPSPRKTRSKGAGSFKHSRGPPATSGSDDMEENEEENSDDSDIEIIDARTASRMKRNVAGPTTMHPAPLYSPKKKRTPRQPRPINQACGVVTQASIEEDDDPLQRHRTVCVACANAPAHVLFEKIKAKGGQAIAQNMAGLKRTGGWLQVRSSGTG